MADESLYFSSIEKTEIISEPEILANTIVTKEAQKNVQTIQVDAENLQPPISNPKSVPKPKRELPKTSAMGSMFKEIHKEVVTIKDENKVELTTENVVRIWKDFLIENEAELQNAFLSAAQNQVPVLVEEQIVFTVSNNVSLEMLQLHKMDITTYFRKKTTSTLVAPFFKLQRDESQMKSYKTTKDRLKDMIDTNAAVLKLIEKFDLNLD